MFFGGNGTAVANFFCTGKSLGAGLGENSVPKKSQNKFGFFNLGKPLFVYT